MMGETKLNGIHLVALVAVGVPLLLIISLAMGWWTVSQLSNPGPIIGAAGIVSNIILTVFLIGIYYQIATDQAAQTEASKNQTRFLEEQQRLMKAQFTPEITVEAITGGKEDIRLSCLNKGSGPAKNVRLEPKYYIEKKNGEVLKLNEFGDIEDTGDPQIPEYFWGFETLNAPLHQLSNDSQIRRDGGAIIKGDEQVELATTPKLNIMSGYDGDDTQITSLQSAFDTLQEKGATKFGFQFYLHYDNEFEEEYSPIFLGSGGVRLSKVDSLEDLIEVREKTTCGEAGYGRYHTLYIDLDPQR